MAEINTPKVYNENTFGIELDGEIPTIETNIKEKDNLFVPKVRNDVIYHEGDILFGPLNLYQINAQRVEPEKEYFSNIIMYATKKGFDSIEYFNEENMSTLFIYLGMGKVREYYSNKDYTLIDEFELDEDTVLLLNESNKEDFMSFYAKIKEAPVGIGNSKLRKVDINDKEFLEEFSKNFKYEKNIIDKINERYESLTTSFKNDMYEIRASYFPEAYATNAINKLKKSLVSDKN